MEDAERPSDYGERTLLMENQQQNSVERSTRHSGWSEDVQSDCTPITPIPSARTSPRPSEADSRLPLSLDEIEAEAALRDVDVRVSTLVSRLSMRQTIRAHPDMTEKPQSKAVFADSEAMKEKLHEHLARPQYDVCNFYYEEGLFQLVARHSKFEQMTLTVISLNALYIAIDTDLNKGPTLTTAAWPFQLSEHAFCFYFTLEWFIRFMAFQRKRDGLRDFWFVFDSFMVAFMVAETWLLTLVFAYLIGGESGGANGGVFRLLRLLRLSRMARMAKLLSAMPELLILVKGMAAAMRSVFFTLILQLIILYVFGIGFVVMTADSPLEETFSSVPVAMHILLIKGTFIDNVGELIFEMAKEHIMALFLFYAFVLLSALTVMNMLIGVLCDVISAVASVEHEALTCMYVVDQLQEIMHQGGLDTDGDGEISKQEFGQMMENPMAARILSGVGVDVFALVELADYVFEAQEQLTFGDFMEVVLSLRGSNSASVKDIVDLRRSIQITNRKIAEQTHAFGRHIACHLEPRGLARLQAMGPTSEHKEKYAWTARESEVSQLVVEEAPPPPEALQDEGEERLLSSASLTTTVSPGPSLCPTTLPSSPSHEPAATSEAQAKSTLRALHCVDWLRPELDRIRKLRTNYSASMTRICMDLQTLHDASFSRPVRVPGPVQLGSEVLARRNSLISLPPMQPAGRKLSTAALRHTYCKVSVGSAAGLAHLQKAPQLEATVAPIATATAMATSHDFGASGSAGSVRVTATLSVSVDVVSNQPPSLPASVGKAMTRCDQKGD
eukprot:TRINITY_DN18312_c0_g2_i1.p1 TRINITY_DN18312_c0_g2~~TRINITY_DN18312_c0_g2_i1.p1  ORF type:complete len:785 (-),score=129.14 TRINITY_DN18312_c0_g2_i1:190-2544(-)